MYIHTGLRRLATNLEALQRPPVVIVAIVDTDSVDAIPQVLQVDNVGIPRRADIVIADKLLRVVDVDDLAVQTGAQRHGLTAALATDDEVVQAVLAGTGGTAALVADECGHFTGINDGIAIFQLDDHCHVVRIEA